MSKTCGTCGQSRQASEFPKSRNTADGLADVCKGCKDSYKTSGERALRAAQQNMHFQKKREQIYKLLGNRCAHCGTQAPPLHIDHKNWREKEFEVLQRQLSLESPKMRAELQKCQLLCERDHNIKTIQDRAEQRAEKDLLRKRNAESEWLAHERTKRGRKS